MKVKFFLSYDTHQSLSFSCHSGLVSESHPICNFEVSRNLLSLFFVKKTNEKRLGRNALISLKILQTLRAKTFLTLHLTIFLT